MSNLNIIEELERIYSRLLSNGDYNKASEVLLKIADLQAKNESVPGAGKNILLG